MSTFNSVRDQLVKHIERIFKNNAQLYVVAVDKDAVWEQYLNSFPTGTNKIFRERADHDCVACKHFFRDFGNVVFIDDNYRVHSIWDMNLMDDDTYGPVFFALDAYVRRQVVTDVFSTTMTQLGVDYNMDANDGGTPIKWRHFYTKIPGSHQNRTSKSDATIMGQRRDAKNVLRRSLDEIHLDAIKTIVELIQQNSIYRGPEWLKILQTFMGLKITYDKLDDSLKDNFCWATSVQYGPTVSKIRNHSIGTLLVDVSEGEDLDVAVKKYEAIVAPQNYKRPKPIFSKKMLADARDTVEQLGLTTALRRRFATIDDITVNNVLFADRASTNRMTGDDVFEELAEEIPVNPKEFARIAEMPIAKFITDVLPTATKIEMYVENRHQANMVSLIAPAHADSNPMFKWDNNFSWAYVGNVADSMKERVKQAGGKVDGVLRFSIQWNEDRDNQNDFDAHSIEPTGNKIFFRNKGRVHQSSGRLDVDIMDPGNKTAVENIIYTNLGKMPDGVYEFRVHTYSDRGGKSGFRAQVEFDGVIHEFDLMNRLAHTPVAKVRYHKETGFELVESADTQGVIGRKMGGVTTNTFQPVTVMLNSPNYWDGKTIGNKHWMFMLQGCTNDECPNGFFNEYLRNDLLPHKRVFAALGGKMAVEPSPAQLSGLGFSSSKRDIVILKVHGHTQRVVKVAI